VKIVVWGINYRPELTGIAPYNTALCEHLARGGHDVRMVTTFCYYPAWRKLPEDRGRLFRTDSMGGVQVHRCWHYVPRRVSAIRRIVHEGSFVLTSLARLFLLPKPDVMVVVSPPLLLGAAAWVYRFFRGVPFVFHVQDLQPDAAVGLGMLKPSLFVRMLYKLESFAYAKAARVTGISGGMLRAYTRKGVPQDKQALFPNGVTLPDAGQFPEKGAFRRRAGIPDGKLLAVYSGNLGVKQGLEILLDAAERLATAPVQIVICGDGARREALEEQIRARSLSNVRMLPLQPEQQYREMMVDTDVSLVTQQAGAGAAFFPSKLLSALAYGLPVLAVGDADSELSRAVSEGRFGIVVPPGNPEELARALAELATDKAGRDKMGENGRAFVEQFSFDRVHEDFERLLREVAAEERK
jgi:colanic acid biosynthesis glycosyl transferase WcaI